MKKLSLAALVFAVVLVTGCTSYSGISKADKSGSYYITSNTAVLWITPNVNLCDAGTKGDLQCRKVNVTFK